MKLSNIASLYWTRLRHRLPQELLALLGIATGVALVFAALVANTSLTGSVRELTEGVVGKASLQVMARGPEGFDQDLLAEVRRTKGVDEAAAVLEARANLIGPRARRSVLLLGGDYSFSELGGTFLPDLDKPDVDRPEALAVPAPLAEDIGITVGQSVPIQIGRETVEVTFGAPLRERDAGDLVNSPVALLQLRHAQRITAMHGKVSRIFVRPLPGRDRTVEARLRRLVGDRLNVVSADADVAAFERAAYPTNQSTTLFSVFSALVGFLFAFSAMLLTVPQRQRLIADLQLAGHPPWVLLEILLFDAAVLGLAGSVVGLVLGDQVARLMFGTAPDYLTAAFAIGSQQIVSWQSAVIAAACGLVAAVVAVLLPLRDVLTGHPLVRREVSPRRTGSGALVIAGTLCLASTTLIAILAPRMAIAAIAFLTLALLLMLPLALRISIGAFQRLSRDWRTPIPTLVSYQLRSPAVWARAIAVAATGAIAVFATVAIGGGDADLQRGLEGSARDIDSNADIWITFAGQGNTLGTTAFAYSSSSRAELARLDGVSSVRTYRGGLLDVGDRRAWVLAPPAGSTTPVPVSQVRRGDAGLAGARVSRGGWIALSEAIAETLAVTVGDRVTLPSPVPIALRVAAVTSNLAWPPGAIVLNAHDYARAWGSRAISGWHVEVTRGASSGAVATRIERALGPRSPLAVETTHERIERHYATARNALARLKQISVVVLASAIVALAAAMGGMIWQRRPAMAQLKVQGYPQGELWRLLIVESALLLGTGGAAGAVFGLYGQIVLSRALETVTGFPLVYEPAFVPAATMLGLVTILAVAMLAVPGWLAARVQPQPDLRTA